MPRRLRAKSAQQIAQQLRRQLGELPGFQAFVNLPSALQIGGRVGDSTYSVTVQSADTDELYTAARQLSSAMEHIREIQDVSSDLQLKSPRVEPGPRSRQGGNARAERHTRSRTPLTGGYGQRWSSTIYGDTAQYKVLLEIDPRYQEYADSLQRAQFPDRARHDGVARVGAHGDGNSWSTKCESFGPAPRRRHFVRPAARRVPRSGGRPRPDRREHLLPPTVNVVFEGSAKVFQESTKNLNLLLFVADRRRLHRARRALRELHPPDHDSLGPAVGGPGSARDVVAVRERAQHLFVRRLDHADWHRQEERDHAG